MHKSKHLIFVAFLLILSTIACLSSGAVEEQVEQKQQTPYEEKIDNAEPGGGETRLELSNGAAVIIPASAINAKAQIKLERNPVKAKDNPPLDGSLIEVSDFYNVEIEGSLLMEPADLVLPFDPALVPEEGGFFVVAAPNGNGGWEYTPVIPEGNQVVFSSLNFGDPLIAWHFPYDQDLGATAEADIAAKKATPDYCDPKIEIQVAPAVGEEGTEFIITGRLLNGGKRFGSIFDPMTYSKPAGQKTISIQIRQARSGYSVSPNKIETQTDDDGRFTYRLTIDQFFDGIKEGDYIVYAETHCDKWGGLDVASTGSAHFLVISAVEVPEETAAVEKSPAPTLGIETSPPAVTIPTGAVQIPDTTGQYLGDAVDTLEALGFGVTWIDGKSQLEIGQIYDQAPAAGLFYVPHRTTVVLYRTMEKEENPENELCSELGLTPEECANAGTHMYFESCEAFLEDCMCCSESNGQTVQSSFNFSADAVEYIYWTGNASTYQKIGINKYQNVDPVNQTFVSTLTFNSTGFINETYYGEYLCVKSVVNLDE